MTQEFFISFYSKKMQDWYTPRNKMYAKLFKDYAEAEVLFYDAKRNYPKIPMRLEKMISGLKRGVVFQTIIEL